MFCLYKNCEHSDSRNSCEFKHFPIEECAFKIWKRYAGTSQKRLNAVKEPCLCSCHFKLKNDFPIPYLLEDKTRNINEIDSTETQESCSNSPMEQQEKGASYNFDEILYENEEYLDDEPCDEVEKKGFLLEVVNRQCFDDDYESNRNHIIPGNDGEATVFNVEFVTTNQQCSIQTSSPTFLNEIITGT